MKLVQFWILLFTAYLLMGILDQVITPTSPGFVTEDSNFIYSLFLQPWNWSTQQLFTILGSAVAAGVAIAAVTSFISRSDISALQALALAMMSAGAIPLAYMYGFITRNIESYSGLCTAGTACFESTIIGGLIVGTLSIMYVGTVLEWWMWRQTQ